MWLLPFSCCVWRDNGSKIFNGAKNKPIYPRNFFFSPLPNQKWWEVKALVASKRSAMVFCWFLQKKLIHFGPPFFLRGKFLPQSCKTHAYKKKNFFRIAKSNQLKIEKNDTCRRYWALIIYFSKQFESLNLMSKVWLDDNQVTFFHLLWKYIRISPYVKCRHSSVTKVSQDYCETMRPRLVSRYCNTKGRLIIMIFLTLKWDWSQYLDTDTWH